VKNKKTVFVSLLIVLSLLTSVVAIAVKNSDTAKYVKITVSGKSSYYSLGKNMKTEKNGVRIKIENNTAYVTESTCRDKICINAGKLDEIGDVAVCLPNEVTVSITGKQGEQVLYSDTFIDTFDTVVTLYGYATSKEEFASYFKHFQSRMTKLSDLFDGFGEGKEYNLYTVNKEAGNESVTVDEVLVKGVLFALDMQKKTEGHTDPSFGAVTKLWRDFINGDGLKPDDEMLARAYEHCGIDKIKVENNSIYITDKETLLDVGATAKGFCAEMVADELVSMGMEDFCINAGGNVVVRGNKKDIDGWEIGIQNPFGEGSIMTVRVKNEAVVTSGSYRRYREGYNHIIDVKTLYPSSRYASVTVIADDSGVADAFSTALFCMDIEEGKVLAKRNNLEVIWITNEGDIIKTDGC